MLFRSSCVQMMAAAAEEANCPIKLELSPVASRVLQGDPGRIQQIIVNLLSNAFKFAPNGDVEISVTERPGGIVRYAVRDCGPGISAADQAKLFRRFKRLELEDVKRLSRGIEKLKPFLVCADWSPGALTDRADLRQRVEPQQLDLF